MFIINAHIFSLYNMIIIASAYSWIDQAQVHVVCRRRCPMQVVHRSKTGCDRDPYASCWLVKICWLGGTHSDTDAAGRATSERSATYRKIQNRCYLYVVYVMVRARIHTKRLLLTGDLQGRALGKSWDGGTPQEQLNVSMSKHGKLLKST
jgi:hypothetical protein